MEEVTDFLDHCVTVFAFWVLFVACRYLPIKRFIVKLVRTMGYNCCDGLIREEESNHDNNERDVFEYRHLSNERKNEIDGNRSRAIIGYQHGFSLTLKREHMVKCMSESESQLASLGKDNDYGIETTPQSSFNVPETTDAQYSQEHNNKNEIPLSLCFRLRSPSQDQTKSELFYMETGPHLIPDRHIEMRESSQCNTDSIKGVDHAAADEKCANYTHIATPLPGHDVNGRTIHEVYDFENQKDETIDPPQKNKLNSIGGKANVKESVTEGIRPKEKEQVTSSLEVRHVPLSCAICLTDYEESERISWASNPECTHVFHEDCIVQWLVTLGRNHAVSLDPNETEFLDYKLECPCCRQDFILKPETRQSRGDDAV